jgi:hypothetical protein
VARFVGSANVADAALASKLAGREAAPFAVRAEHVAVQPESAELGANCATALGEVLAVLFHGADCRWQVRLDAGETWSAVLSESDTRQLEGLAVGCRVRLSWPRDAAVPLENGKA